MDNYERLLRAIFGEKAEGKAVLTEVKGLPLRRALLSILLTIDAREVRILYYRFGLGTNPPLTLKEVGQAVGVSGERIRQIEAKALRKLRHPSRSGKLKPFLSQA